MKNKMLKTLILILVTTALIAAFAVPAYADGDVVKVTLAKGDTLYSLCQKQGFDPSTYKALVMLLNGWTKDSQLNSIPAGREVILPASAASAASLAKAFNLNNNNNNNNNNGVTPTPSPNPSPVIRKVTIPAGKLSAMPSGTGIGYYLTEHTMQRGETISGIYKSMGGSYKDYSAQILAVNHIKSFNRVNAGKTLLLPVASGTGASYTVIAHKIQRGETAYGICSAYQMNWKDAKATLEALNPNVDLTKIRAGAVLYIPINGVLTSA